MSFFKEKLRVSDTLFKRKDYEISGMRFTLFLKWLKRKSNELIKRKNLIIHHKLTGFLHIILKNIVEESEE